MIRLLTNGIAALLGAAVVAQTPQLLRDINPASGAGSTPFLLGQSPRTGEVLFSADDGVHGRELWTTDGTAQGTSLVLDMAPGPAGTQLGRVTVIGSRGLLLVQRLGDHELWTTDGTGAGTNLLLAASTVGAGILQAPLELIVPGVVAFGVDGTMWRTDGTAAGTFSLGVPFGFGSVIGEVGEQTVLQLPNGDVAITDGVTVTTLFHVPGRVLIGPDGNAYSLVFTGSVMAPQTTVTWVNGSGQPSLVVWGYLPWFFPIDGGMLLQDNGAFRIWNTGTGLVTPVPGLVIDPSGPQFQPVGDEWLFLADDPAHGKELWLTDGTATGTRVLDLLPGPGSSDPGFSTELDNGLLVWADLGVAGREPALVDPVMGTATVLLDLQPGPGSSAGGAPLFGGQGRRRALVVASTQGIGAEWMLTDGTSAGTQVFDLHPGFAGSVQLTSLPAIGVGGSVVFSVADGTNGIEPWVLDLPGSARLERGYAPVDVEVSDPILGGSIEVDLSDVPSGRLGVLALGFPTPIGPAIQPDRHLHLDPLSAVGVAVIVPTANGAWSGSIPLANQPSALGLDVILQPVLASTSSPLTLDVASAWWLSLGF